MKNGKDRQNDKQIPNPQRKKTIPKEMESGSMTYHCTCLHWTKPIKKQSKFATPVHLSDLSAGKLCQLGYPVFKHTETDAPLS